MTKDFEKWFKTYIENKGYSDQWADDIEEDMRDAYNAGNNAFLSDFDDSYDEVDDLTILMKEMNDKLDKIMKTNEPAQKKT